MDERYVAKCYEEDNLDANEDDYSDEVFLNSFQRFRALYDKADKNHKDALYIENCWTAVAESIGISVEEAKSTWARLKRKYLRQRKMLADGPRSGSAYAPTRKWALQYSMQFLDKHVATRKSSFNPIMKKRKTDSYPTTYSSSLWNTDPLQATSTLSHSIPNARSSFPSSSCANPSDMRPALSILTQSLLQTSASPPPSRFPSAASPTLTSPFQPTPPTQNRPIPIPGKRSLPAPRNLPSTSKIPAAASSSPSPHDLSPISQIPHSFISNNHSSLPEFPSTSSATPKLHPSKSSSNSSLPSSDFSLPSSKRSSTSSLPRPKNKPADEEVMQSLRVASHAIKELVKQRQASSASGEHVAIHHFCKFMEYSLCGYSTPKQVTKAMREMMEVLENNMNQPNDD